jgi:hypothetical protein
VTISRHESILKDVEQISQRGHPLESAQSYHAYPAYREHIWDTTRTTPVNTSTPCFPLSSLTRFVGVNIEADSAPARQMTVRVAKTKMILSTIYPRHIGGLAGWAMLQGVYCRD